jgi:Tfp pilus assembly protein PilO
VKKLSRFTQRERLLLAILGGLLLLTLIYYLLMPQVLKYQEICQDIEQTTKENDQLAKINQELAEEQTKLLETQYQLLKLKKYFNQELRDGGLFIKLDEGAHANEVTIKEVVPQKVVYDDAFLHLPIIISISGDYRNVLAYMQWLENSNDWSNLSEISQFVIEPTGGLSENDDGIVNINLTLSLYSTVTPENRMQIETYASGMIGRSNGFTPPLQYHYLHNNQQNGGQ